MKLLRRLIQEDAGVTSIEYAFLAVLIAVGIVGAVTALGIKVSDFFGDTAGAFP